MGRFFGSWGGHELADGLQDAGDGLVVGIDPPFQFLELLRQFLVCGDDLAEMDEGAHHVHA